MIVGEEIPGVSPWAIVLAHRAPLAFAQVGTPFLPCCTLKPVFLESLFFGSHRMVLLPFSQIDEAQGRRVRGCRISNQSDLRKHQGWRWWVNFLKRKSLFAKQEVIDNEHLSIEFVS